MTKITEHDVKTLIIETLDLDDLSVDDIDSNAPLFGEGLELDSIDALEIGVTLKKKYNITIDSDDSDNKTYFETITSLTQFINQHIK